MTECGVKYGWNNGSAYAMHGRPNTRDRCRMERGHAGDHGQPAHGTPAGEPCTHPRVYFDMAADNFYCGDCRRGMGVVFWHQWRRHYEEFGISAESAGPPPRSDSVGGEAARCPDCGCGGLMHLKGCRYAGTPMGILTPPAPEPESARERKLEAALRNIEALLCDKPLCGHFTAEEIRAEARAALEPERGEPR